MSALKLSRISWLRITLLSGAAILVAGLNLAADDSPSMAFDEPFDLRPGKAFGRARGWPLKFVAPASEEACDLVHASLIQGNTKVYRDAFKESAHFRHLAINWLPLAFDALVAAAFLALSALIPTLVCRRQSPAER